MLTRGAEVYAFGDEIAPEQVIGHDLSDDFPDYDERIVARVCVRRESFLVVGGRQDDLINAVTFKVDSKCFLNANNRPCDPFTL